MAKIRQSLYMPPYPQPELWKGCWAVRGTRIALYRNPHDPPTQSSNILEQTSQLGLRVYSLVTPFTLLAICWGPKISGGEYNSTHNSGCCDMLKREG